MGLPTRLSAFLASLLLLAAVAQAEYFQTSLIQPEPGEKFKSAQYSLYIPDGVKTVRCIIVRQHACGAVIGIIYDHDLQWQALAKKHDAALMGTRLIESIGCGEWADPAKGTGRAFL